MAEAPPMVCYSRGVLDSLVDKIHKLLNKLARVEETHPKVNPLLNDLLNDLKSLREDLVNKFAGGLANWEVKLWMKHGRQLFYDIEDMIDLKLGKTDDVDESETDFEEETKKLKLGKTDDIDESETEFEEQIKKLKLGKTDDIDESETDFEEQIKKLKLGKTDDIDESETDFEEQIKTFRDKIKEARDRSTGYGLSYKVPTSDPHDASPSSKDYSFNPQLIWEKKGVLVGIDGPRKKLEEHLKDTQKKKAVSVLGTGGLGKTTLATKVYEELKGQFDCHASVTVGGNSPIAALMDMFLQVKPEMVGHAFNVQEVIRQLWGFLKDKSYFIFIDDIRSKHAWSIINCVLPNNNLGSRILATTRVKDVAMSCSARPADFIYEMKGLSESDSRSLLYSAIPAETESNFETECPDMLKMCCGLPLAIIVTSGLLALKSADLGPFGKLEESSLSISDVLNMCFANLSSPVKACFLYLSSFPENYTIKKGRLIWRWVAEGFIPQIGQASMWETGEGYFNELLCRKLIRPVFDDNNDDQAVVCTVHPVIHEFIASLSRQEDFHTTAAELISGPFPYGTIRRFSVDCSRQENNEADTLKSSVIHLSAVRSLTVFGAAGSVPDIGTFKHLRVLDLEDTKSFDDQQAERIKHLFLLRYLGLGGTNITKLPQQIMALKHLATLDLRRTKVRELPSFGNKKLLSLFASLLTIPGGMGGMEELEELSEVLLGRDFQLNLDGSHAKDVAELVSKSRRLRVLGVKFGYRAETEPKGMNHFLKEVGESKLQSLSLDGYPYDSFALLVNYWAPNKRPQKLQKFELRMSGCLPKVPLEMKYIEALTHLHIQVKVVEAQDVRTLGKLPNLILLKLHSEESTQERLSVSRIDDGFPRLMVFWFRSSYCLQFEAGAMPRLQRLKIEFNARKTKIFYRNYDFGLQHLGCLQHVRVIIFCQHAKDPEVKAAEASIRDQVSRIREAENRPTSSVDIRISILPESSWHMPPPGTMEFATGTFGSLLPKLANLLHGEYKLQRDVRKNIEFVTKELETMQAALRNVGEVPLEQLPDLDRIWARDARELSYDMEDVVDNFLVHIVGPDPPSEGKWKEFTQKMKRILGGKRHQIGKQIEKLKKRVEELDALRDRCKVDTIKPDVTTLDPRITALYAKETDLIGINKAREELIMKLTKGDDVSMQQQMIVSIVGFGGLGKTTLAKAVHEEIKSQFDCTAFVTVSQNPDRKKILKDMLYELNEGVHGNIHDRSLDEKQLIDIARKFLCDKRYLIIIDDIWKTSDWDMIIKHALPDNNTGCRIITTTRNVTVANHIGCPYEMQPLSPDSSRELMYRRIFGTEDPENCLIVELAEVSKKILKKCAGVPLAIITIASLLASKRRNKTEWDEVYNSIGKGMENSLDAENMKKILSYSYYDLPSYLRTCLLYLSVFPEDFEIIKDRLIWLWIAEGFIQPEEQWTKSLFELGESYFNELMNRSMIQPAYRPSFFLRFDTEIRYCRVHDVVLDLIRSISSEENFVTILSSMNKTSQSTRVRRLSHQNGEIDHAMIQAIERRLVGVRSVVVFPSAPNQMPILPSFKVLRVLDLQGCDLSHGYSLQHLGDLFHLRFLSLRDTEIDQLPVAVGNLKFLEILDVSGNDIDQLPNCVAQLTRLLCLKMSPLTRVSNGIIESLTSLEELSDLGIDEDSRDIVKALGLLTELRVLDIVLLTDEQADMLLLESVCKLRKIRRLKIGYDCEHKMQRLYYGYECERNMGGLDAWVPPPQLRELDTQQICWVSVLPAWMNNPTQFQDLWLLEIAVRKVQQEDLEILGRLPALRMLDLKVDHEDIGISGKGFVVAAGSFPCLQECRLLGFLCPVVFHQGAMPRLRKLGFLFFVRKAREIAGSDGGLLCGLANLQSLEAVTVFVRASGASKEEVDEAKAAVTREAEIHPNRPILDFHRR